MKSALTVAICILTLGIPLPASLAAPDSPASPPTFTHARYLSALKDLHNAGIPTTLAAVYPEPPAGARNAAPIYMKLGDKKSFPAGQDERDALGVLMGQLTPSDWANARAFLVKHADLVKEVHLAASMTICALPGRSTAKNPEAVLFPRVAYVRRAARIIAVESLVMAHDGKPIEALDNAELGFRIADHAYECPTLIGWLVGVATDAVVIRSIEDIMIANRSDPAVVAAADHAIARGWRPHNLVHAIKGEAACDLSEVEFLRADKTVAAGIDDITGSPEDVAFLKLAVKSPGEWNEFLDTNGVRLSEYYRERISDLSRPYPTASANLARLDTAAMNNQDSDMVLVHMFCATYSKMMNLGARLEARAAIARAAAGVLDFKDSHGVYPAALSDAMTPVPLDPYVGLPIRYRRDGDGFVLYSVGATGKYDGGSNSVSEAVLRVDGAGVMSWE